MIRLPQLQKFHFNPRSRVGSDLHHPHYCSIFCNFNPRSRVGSDTTNDRDTTVPKISIHAPVWGATRA